MSDFESLPCWKKSIEMYKAFVFDRELCCELAKKYNIASVYTERWINKIGDLLYNNDPMWAWDIDNLEHLMAVSSKYIEDKWVTRVAFLVLNRFRSPKEFLQYKGKWSQINGAGARYRPVLAKIYNDEAYRKIYLEA